MENITKEKDIRYGANGWVDVTDLPHNGKYINWKESYGMAIPFRYQNIEDILVIKECSIKDKVIIQYKDVEKEVYAFNLLKAKLRSLFKEIHYDWVWSIGDTIKINTGSYTIIDKYRSKRGDKRYKYICDICGHEADVRESDLLAGHGCASCAGHKTTIGFNDFNTLHPSYAKFLVNIQDGEVSPNSKNRVKWQCEHCQTVYEKDLYAVHKSGIACPICHKTKSLGERIMESVLIQLGVNYESQKKFNWSDRKRYDFYLIDLNWIIEVHGIQHYYDKVCFGNKTLEKEQSNDKYKENIAIDNGIDKYVIINAEKSDVNWIRDSILNSEIAEVYDLSNIDWTDSRILGVRSDYMDIVNLWNDGKTAKEIRELLNFEKRKVLSNLRLAASNGDIDYSIKEIEKRGGKTPYMMRPIRCTTNNLCFNSIVTFKNLSKSLFGTEYKGNNFSSYIKNNTKFLNKYTFEYITMDEFNMVKQKSPDYAFGDFFDLDKVG